VRERGRGQHPKRRLRIRADRRHGGDRLLPRESDAYPHADGYEDPDRDSDGHVDSDLDRHLDGHVDSDRDRHLDAHADRDRDSDADAHADRHPDVHADAHAHPNRDIYLDRHADAYPHCERDMDGRDDRDSNADSNPNPDRHLGGRDDRDADPDCDRHLDGHCHANQNAVRSAGALELPPAGITVTVFARRPADSPGMILGIAHEGHRRPQRRE
jgi:hypothetical protein